MKLSKLLLLMEMPLALGGRDMRGGDSSAHNVSRIGELEQFMQDTFPEPMDSFTVKGLDLNVFEVTKPTGKLHEYAFVRMEDDVIVANYAGTQTKDGGIETEYIETRKGAMVGASLMAEIYKAFLLKRYKYILSDDTLSAWGFNFWFRNFDDWVKAGYKVYVVDLNAGTQTPLRYKEELHDYLGKSDLDEYYRYKLSKK